MGAIGFTSADLDANRHGNLGRSQAERLKRTRQRNTIIGGGLFLVIVVVATVFIFFGQQKQSPILSAVGGLLTVINAIMVGMVGRAYLRITADLRDGNIEILEGELERVVRRGRQRDDYLLRANGASITVTTEIFIQFRHESPYRIYRTRLSGVLLSAEPLTDS